MTWRARGRVVEGIALAAGFATLAVLLPGCASGGGAGGHVIRVTEKGFEPAVTVVEKGRPVTLLVTRKTDRTCATELVFAGIDTTFDLPLHRTVRIELPADLGDTLRYACAMDMIKGLVVAR
jgi:plastocyanin domain-containing protein